MYRVGQKTWTVVKFYHPCSMWWHRKTVSLQISILCTSAVKLWYTKSNNSAHVFFLYESLLKRWTFHHIVRTSVQSISHSWKLFSKDCYHHKVWDIDHNWFMFCYTVGCSESGHNKGAPDQLLKRPAIVIRAYSGHGGMCLVLQVFVIGVAAL